MRKTIIEHVAECAANNPKKLAVMTPGDGMSYGTLYEYAMGYAKHLVSNGIERGAIVGLGREDYTIYREFQGMMVFKPELETYLEALTGALCDRFQARDGFFAVIDDDIMNKGLKARAELNI